MRIQSKNVNESFHIWTFIEPDFSSGTTANLVEYSIGINQYTKIEQNRLVKCVISNANIKKKYVPIHNHS